MAVVVVPVDVVVNDRFVDEELNAVGCETRPADTGGIVRVGQAGGGNDGTNCTCGGVTITDADPDNGVVVIVVVVVVVIAAGVQSAAAATTAAAAVDADDRDDRDDDRDDDFFGTSSRSVCCIMSRLRQLSAMLSRFFQMVATVLLARPSSRATSLLLLPRSISWMIFIFCLIVNASRFRPCVGWFQGCPII